MSHAHASTREHPAAAKHPGSAPRRTAGPPTAALAGAAPPFSMPAIQRRPAIGARDDRFEREAEAVADRVLGMASAPVLMASPIAIQRLCSTCSRGRDDEERPAIQAMAMQDEGISATGARVAVEVAGRGGMPLPAEARGFFEPRFGHDFSQVRVHADGDAGRAATGIQARAYTVGRDIVFAPGEYSPGTSAGRRLIAHELTHVVQQTGGGASSVPGVQRDGTAPAAVSYAGCTAAQSALIDAARTTALTKAINAVTAFALFIAGAGSTTQRAALAAHFGTLGAADLGTVMGRYVVISARLANPALFACGAPPAQPYCGPPDNWCAGTVCPTTTGISYLCAGSFGTNCAEPNLWSILLHEAARAAGCCPPDVMPGTGYPPASPACLTNVYSYSGFARAI